MQRTALPVQRPSEHTGFHTDRRGLGVVVVVSGGGLALTVNMLGPEFRVWVRGLERLGGCSGPVMLMGHTITRDASTGAVVHAFTSADLPGGVLMLPCRNRREQVCVACSLLHNGDSFQIVRSGIVGGKGVPAEVSTHPLVFATVTAPSFGAVHRANGVGVCRPERGEQICEHGCSRACWARHADADPIVGSPLCAACYRYADAVVWNAASGLLWVQYINRLRRELARLGGLRIRTGEIGRVLRVSYVKVSEFQRRGSVHFHAVIRVDGPDGPDDDPPDWVSTGLLADAVSAAGPRATVGVAQVGGDTRVIGFGRQLDVREIGGGRESAQAASSYLAKYITKDDGNRLVLPRPVLARGGIDAVPRALLSDHARVLMHAAWDLGGLPELAELRLRPWAHQLGFRGNVVTKSRFYSTTYGALREARAAHAREAAGLPEVVREATVTESHWRLVAAGLSPELGEIAAGIADGTVIRKGPRPNWIADFEGVD